MQTVVRDGSAFSGNSERISHNQLSSSGNRSTGHGDASRGTAREAFQYRERRLTETEEIEKSRETKVSRGCERTRERTCARARARERTGFSLVAPSVHGALAHSRRGTGEHALHLVFSLFVPTLFVCFPPTVLSSLVGPLPLRPAAPLHVSLSCSLCAK